jgi:hypothetical protein
LVSGPQEQGCSDYRQSHKEKLKAVIRKIAGYRGKCQVGRDVSDEIGDHEAGEESEEEADHDLGGALSEELKGKAKGAKTRQKERRPEDNFRKSVFRTGEVLPGQYHGSPCRQDQAQDEDDLTGNSHRVRILTEGHLLSIKFSVGFSQALTAGGRVLY